MRYQSSNHFTTHDYHHHQEFLNFYNFIKFLQFTTFLPCVLIILKPNPPLTPPRFISTSVFLFFLCVVSFPSSPSLVSPLVHLLLGNATLDSLQRLLGHRNPVAGYELQKQAPRNVSHNQRLVSNTILKISVLHPCRYGHQLCLNT